MNVYPRRELFYKKPHTRIYRLFLIIVLILGGVWLIRGVDQGEIERPFTATATPHTFGRFLRAGGGCAVHRREP